LGEARRRAGHDDRAVFAAEHDSFAAQVEQTDVGGSHRVKLVAAHPRPETLYA